MNKLRIAMVGTHGVGKTTLINAIQHPHKIKEIARTYLIKETKPSEMSASERVIFQNHYWHLQIAEEYTHKKRGFLSDRSALDIIAYSIGFFKESHIERLKKEVIGRYDILFYIPIEFPLEVDGVRSPNKEYQKLINTNIQQLIQWLAENDKNVKMRTLTGTVEQRVKQFNLFVEIIDNAMKDL